MEGLVVTSPYPKTLDQILNDILTDYSNLSSAPDTSKGGSPFIMGSVLASAAWSIHKYIDYSIKQHFVHTCDAKNLNEYGVEYNFPRTSSDETDQSYATRLLTFLRGATAGGNAGDFKRWALDQENCYLTVSDVTYYNAFAPVIHQADGAGTVGVYTVPNDETIVNNGGNSHEADLLAVTQAYLSEKIPLGTLGVTAYSSDPVLINVSVLVTPEDNETIDTTEIQTEISNMMNLKEPSESLYQTDITFVCRNFGGKVAQVVLPADFETTVLNAQHIRPGTVEVYEN